MLKPHISTDINESLKGFLLEASYTSMAILVDENTKQFCLPLLNLEKSTFNIIEIKSGEENKGLDTCASIWSQITALKMDRKSLLINLGGGVIGDMGGFCAATYKRGIDFINIPTTLLAQVDASVGGKLGIDFNGFKNHIGLFKQPNAILVDTTFLNTLPKRELRSGFAEIIKHAIIADNEQWDFLKQKSFEEHNFSELVKRSVNVKINIVEEDPLEQGKRKILNYGHTIGHAVETHFLSTPNSKLLHGEAIAVGMICEAYIAHKKNLITKDELREIHDYIHSIYGLNKINSSDYDEIIELMYQDKKNTENKILMALPNGIGSTVWDVEVSQAEILEAIEYYMHYQM